jgi:hypothetical protein
MMTMSKKTEPDIGDFGTNIPTPDPCCDWPDPEECQVSATTLNQLVEELDGKSTKNDSANPTQWTTSGPDTFVAVPPTISKLVPGVYTMEPVRGSIHFHRRKIEVDDLLKFPNSQADKIMSEISSFWKKGKLFKEYGFLHRRGYLLYGPQGSGKTVLVQQVVADIVKDGGIAFICENPCILESGLEEFRSIEKNRPVVCLFEDIDATVAKYGEDALLSLLDGETQINRVLNVATTNYPEKLDPRIVARPRRFDRILWIGMPTNEVRRMYFEKKLNIKTNELDKWVNSTDEFSFAACAELVISVKCLGIEFEKAIDILRRLMTAKVSSTDFEEKIGFSNQEKKPGFAGMT